jgi:hypothetical protein
MTKQPKQVKAIYEFTCRDDDCFENDIDIDMLYSYIDYEWAGDFGVEYVEMQGAGFHVQFSTTPTAETCLKLQKAIDDYVYKGIIYGQVVKVVSTEKYYIPWGTLD